MKKLLAACCWMAMGVAMVAGTAAAQDTTAPAKPPRLSLPAKADCTLPGGGTIHVDYSAPLAKGRTVFGGLVPYGEVWRAGANEATTFVVSKDVTVGGKAVPAGSYTLFTLPEKDKWTLIVSSKTGEWGVPYPGVASDFARIPMTPGTLPAAQEKFSITLDKSGAGCTMTMAWEKTKASIDIK
jgi:Protein of unknown function (DUF2911)